MPQQCVDLSGVPLHEFFQSLDRHVRTDPIAKLEAVGHGLGGRGDGNLRAFDAVMLDTVGQVRPSNMDKPDRHSAADRPPRVGRNSHPHLERVLGGEPMEAEGGEQAHHASRHLADGPSEVVPDVWVGIGQRINPTGHPSDGAPFDELCEHRSRHAGGLELAAPGDRLAAKQATRLGGRSVHGGNPDDAEQEFANTRYFFISDEHLQIPQTGGLGLLDAATKRQEAVRECTYVPFLVKGLSARGRKPARGTNIVPRPRTIAAMNCLATLATAADATGFTLLKRYLEDREWAFRFVVVACNVGHPAEAANARGNNTLPALLRDWFGPDAGLRGTHFEVEFAFIEGQWLATPHKNPRREPGDGKVGLSRG